MNRRNQERTVIAGILLALAVLVFPPKVQSCEPLLELMCPPADDPQSYIDDLYVQIDGIVSAPPPCEPISRISWNWGDGTIDRSLFPASHSYSEYKTHVITATALDAENNVLISDSCNATLPPPADAIFIDGFECGEIPGNCRSTFKGMTLLAATSDDEMSVAWYPAVDDDTSPADIQYDNHLAPEDRFLPSSLNLKASIVGQTSATIQNLTTATRYYALIIAKSDSLPLYKWIMGRLPGKSVYTKDEYS